MTDYYDIEATSATFLCRMASRNYAHAMVKRETQAMGFGTAFHCLLLEPEKFKRAYSYDWPVNASTGKPYGADTKKVLAWQEHLAERDMLGLRTSDRDRLYQMRDNLLAMPEARTLILNAQADKEREIFWEHLSTGESCKSKLDIISPDYIIDVKTTSDASHSGFMRSIGKWRYDIQATFYQMAAESIDCVERPFYFACVEHEHPFSAAIYPLDASGADANRGLIGRLIEEIQEKRKEGKSFSRNYYRGMGPYVSCPKWAQ